MGGVDYSYYINRDPHIPYGIEKRGPYHHSNSGGWELAVPARGGGGRPFK